MADDAPRPRRSNPPARKSLGQHFLSDPRILERIADALALEGAETVIEIGPGRGALTDILLPRAKRLIAIEYDRALAELLRTRYAGSPHVRIVQRDVLEVNFGELAGDDFVLVGNVPYYITTPILFQALRAPMPRRAVYLIQREVADRLVAPPGSGDYGALTVNVHAVAQVERLFRVPAGAFRPAPKVESAVVRVIPREDPLVAADLQPALKELVQAAFGMRRKQMRRVTRELFGLTAQDAEHLLARSGIDPDVRPETLSPGQFVALLERQGTGPRYQGPGKD